METKRRWQAGFVCVVLLALLTPAALALDVCGETVVFILSAPDPVDIINCATGATGAVIAMDSTVNLLPGAHISDEIAGAPGAGSFTSGGYNIVNIYGGQIDTKLTFGSTDKVRIFGYDFNENLDQIEGPISFTLTGKYLQGDTLFSILCELESDAKFTEAPEIEVLPALLEWDVGDVEVGQSTTMLVQIFNVGNADLTVSSVTLAGDASFTITDGPATPLVIAPNTSIGVDFEVTFAPTAEEASAAVVTIVSDDPDAEEEVIFVDLSGVGIITEVPPTQQIQDIVDFLNSSVALGTIQGYGPGNSASKRLKALKNMIESASDLINAGAYEQAINQLQSISKKTDGVATKPQDFAVGEAVADLNAMIEALITDLGA